jgi:hypothetical protein
MELGAEALKVTRAQAIHGALQLVAYAARSGTVLDDEDVANIVAAERAGDALTPEQEKLFWISAASISKAVAPVTIESLQSSSAEGETQDSPAARAARKYRRRTIVTLFALLIFQIYWLVGAAVTGDLREIRTRLEKLQERYDAHYQEEEALDKNDANYVASKRKLDAARTALWNQIYVERVSGATNFEVLRNWNIAKNLYLWSRTPSLPATKDSVSENFLWIFTKENVVELQTAQITLTAILKYILPILYGALGASAYIVRTLASEIKDSTYSLGSTIRYQLRFYLGAVAGLSIAWFTSDPKAAEASAGILQSLSPLALAFLAGYSVELLFSLLDRIVSAFSGPEPKRTP